MKKYELNKDLFHFEKKLFNDPSAKYVSYLTIYLLFGTFQLCTFHNVVLLKLVEIGVL